MTNIIGRRLIELNSAAQAIGHQPVGIQCCDFLNKTLPYFQGRFMEFLLEPHDARHAATIVRPVHRFNDNAGDHGHEVRIRPPNFLLPLMAGGIIGDVCRYLTEARVQFAAAMKVK